MTWDDKLRAALGRPASARERGILSALTALMLFGLMGGTKLLPRTAAGAHPFVSALALSVPAALLLLGLCDLLRRGAGTRAALGLGCALVGVGMALRLGFLPHRSSDYEIYLARWMDAFASSGFSEAMRGDIGEYNVLYQYLLFLAARLPMPGLTALKAISLMGDAMLCWGIGRLGGKRGGLAFALALLLPSMALNGAMFAQCDALYAAFALWALVFAGRGRDRVSVVCFALCLCMKLQALFLFPVIPVLWLRGRLRLRDLPVFFGTLLLVALPALLGGKTPAQILAIYAGQTGLYTGLSYNAPTLFGLMETQGLDVYLYGRWGILLAMGAALALIAYGTHREMDDLGMLWLSTLCAALVVFLLPRMHERYFFLALALAIPLAVQRPRHLPVLALLELASVSRLLEMGISLRAGSLMVLLALTLLMIPLERRTDPYETR